MKIRNPNKTTSTNSSNTTQPFFPKKGSKSNFFKPEEKEAPFFKCPSDYIAPKLFTGASTIQKSANGCPDCEKLIFMVDNDLPNPYRIALHYNLTLDELLELNPHINPNDMPEGTIVYLPKGSKDKYPYKSKKTTNESSKYDTLWFQDGNDFPNPYRIALHYNITLDELLKLNPHINPNAMPKGTIVYLPKGSKDKYPYQSKKTTGGDPKGKKTILIAWSFDDGPTTHTSKLKQKLNFEGATWFIVRSNMLNKQGGWAKNAERYRQYQKAGGEIGIHAQDEKIDHIMWFPVLENTDKIDDGKDDKENDKYYNKNKSNNPYAYKSIEAAVADLREFNNELKAEKIYPKFVRLPGGLASQLEHYARHLGIAKSAQDARMVRNAVIKGKGFDQVVKQLKGGNYKDRNKYETIVNDYKSLKSALKAMKLLLWGGYGKENPDKISAQSWEAESSGGSLTDNVTSSKGGSIKKGSKGRFEKLADGMKAGETKSLVILAHDTNEKNVTEISNDKKRMEDYAQNKGITIEYVTMSQLFKRITGVKDVKNYTPDY